MRSMMQQGTWVGEHRSSTLPRLVLPSSRPLLVARRFGNELGNRVRSGVAIRASLKVMWDHGNTMHAVNIIGTITCQREVWDGARIRTRLIFRDTFKERLPVLDFTNNHITIDFLVKERFALNLSVSLLLSQSVDLSSTEKSDRQ
jgi:hypothetical protein